MKCIELNKKGNYDQWDLNLLVELGNLEDSVSDNDTNDYIIYRDDGTKMSVFALEIYERIPFRMIKTDFYLVCLSGGMALTRFSHGGISLLLFEKGDYIHHNLNHEVMINDLQNIGESPLIMTLMESSCGISLNRFAGDLMGNGSPTEY